MTLGDIDALGIARRQLRALMADELNLPRNAETRLQLGLLAAQVALAERLPALVASVEPPEFVWDVARLEVFVRELAPKARHVVQVLCEADGSATPEQLQEKTGLKSMAGMTNSVRRAQHAAAPGVPAPQRMVVDTVQTEGKIRRYRIAPETLPLLREALTRYTADPAE